ncbi:hypothetical protein R3P38DRAFT_2779185 [Favolaschia claudopus]|uniref:Uncharacterized protein n=1 Tax=Favolaschia claudopus TaxID=2862362 RepID=A0AAW0BH97_9AGAR
MTRPLAPSATPEAKTRRPGKASHEVRSVVQRLRSSSAALAFADGGDENELTFRFQSLPRYQAALISEGFLRPRCEFHRPDSVFASTDSREDEGVRRRAESCEARLASTTNSDDSVPNPRSTGSGDAAADRAEDPKSRTVISPPNLSNDDFAQEGRSGTQNSRQSKVLRKTFVLRRRFRVRSKQASALRLDHPRLDYERIVSHRAGKAAGDEYVSPNDSATGDGVQRGLLFHSFAKGTPRHCQRIQEVDAAKYLLKLTLRVNLKANRPRHCRKEETPFNAANSNMMRRLHRPSWRAMVQDGINGSVVDEGEGQECGADNASEVIVWVECEVECASSSTSFLLDEVINTEFGAVKRLGTGSFLRRSSGREEAIRRFSESKMFCCEIQVVIHAENNVGERNGKIWMEHKTTIGQNDVRRLEKVLSEVGGGILKR